MDDRDGHDDSIEKSNIERVTRYVGDYVLPPEVGDHVTAEDRRQNHRLKELEDAVAVLKADVGGLWRVFNRLETALIGHDGKNGMRGTMQTHYETTSQRLDKMDTKIDDLSQEVTSLTVDLSSLVRTIQTSLKVGSFVVGLLTTIVLITEILRFFAERGGGG